MKNLNKKSAALLIAVAVLLLATVGGTLAYLIDRTDELTNTFTPTKVDTEIDEEFDGSTKSQIIISNASDSIKVYVRVALVGNWVDAEGNIVRPWTPKANMKLGSDWVKHTDGFYYYTSPVTPGGSTSNLLGENITDTDPKTGETLELTVIQQAVQAEPSTVVDEVWPDNPIP